MCGRTPAGRWGELRELKGVAIFLASDASSFVNGQVIYVDGGLLARHVRRLPAMRALYFTKSAGYEHAVVRPAGGRPSHSEAVLGALGAAHGIEVTCSKDGSLFTPAYLAGFDVIVFYTSGDLLTAGTDGTPPLSAAGKEALIEAVAGGTGFVGIHSAAATFHRPGAGGDPASDPYIAMLGGAFIHHGAEQTATVSVPDPAFPGCGAPRHRVDLPRRMVRQQGVRPRPPRAAGDADRAAWRVPTIAARPTRSPGRAGMDRAASGTTAWGTAKRYGIRPNSRACSSAGSNGPAAGSTPT